MPMPAVITQAGVGTTANPWYPDWVQDPFAIGIGLSINTGTALMSVEHTFQLLDPNLPNGTSAANATWFQNSGLNATTVSTTSNLNGNYAFPVLAIRLNVSTCSVSTAVITGWFVQATSSSW
jgi:hypothetical protein